MCCVKFVGLSPNKILHFCENILAGNEIRVILSSCDNPEYFTYEYIGLSTDHDNNEKK